jgi:hypothetical protein
MFFNLPFSLSSKKEFSRVRGFYDSIELVMKERWNLRRGPMDWDFEGKS